MSSVIRSKPADRSFLDHDHVEDFEGGIYVVIGNSHPPDSLIAYLKYVRSSEETPWGRGGEYFRRVVRVYGARQVMDSVKGLQEFAYDPTLGVRVPVVSLSKVSRVYFPEIRLQEILRKCGDPLECLSVEVASRIERELGVSLRKLGVGGSILPGIHNPVISDIDIVTYGCRESIAVATGVAGVFEKLRGEKLLKRLKKHASRLSLPLELLLKVEPPYKRLAYRGKEVNFMFVNPEPGRYGERILKPVGTAEVTLEIEGGDCRSLYYPSEATVLRVTSVTVHPKGVSAGYIRNSLSRVICYESTFSYLIFRGGELRIKGVIEEVLPGGDLVILVGSYEEPGYVIPARP